MVMMDIANNCFSTDNSVYCKGRDKFEMAENRITVTINGVTKEAPQKKELARVDGMVPYKHISDFQFALSEQIGFGFSSRVYLGRNTKTSEQVAIKVIELAKADALEQQLMNNEVSVLEALRTSECAHVLRLHEVVRSKNNLYIVTEYCEGKDLSKILREKKTLLEAEAQTVMRMLLLAYAQVHTLGYLHRDLKLGNMLMKKGTLKLADFGFAIPAEQCAAALDYNVGSQYYMPPETIRGNAYSVKSDIWALGVIAFEIVHGRLPWKHRNESVLFDTIQQADIEQLIDSTLCLSPGYQEFIRMCLRVDVDARASIEEVLRHEWPQASETVMLGVKEKAPAIMHRPKAPVVVERRILHSTTLSDPLHASSIETVILAQIHFCRFLERLCEMVSSSSLPQKQFLRNQIVNKIMLKLELLLLQGHSNVFNLQGFAEYAQRERWRQLAQMIQNYDQSVKTKFRGEIVHRTSDTNDLLVNVLRRLKAHIFTDFALIEELTFYLQLKEEEVKLDCITFAKTTHLSLLAKPRNHQPLSQELIERLHKKLTLMGL